MPRSRAPLLPVLAAALRGAAADWVQVQELTPSDHTPYGAFGAGVAVSPDSSRMAVLASAGNGTVYIFAAAGGVWSQTQVLSDPNPAWCVPPRDPNQADSFGHAMAFSADGETLAIGDPSELWPDPNNPYYGIYVGAVYIFSLSGGIYSQTQRLLPPAGTNVSASFGAAVAFSIDGFTLAIGVPEPNGSVCLYTRQGAQWALSSTLAPFLGPSYFGVGVAYSIDGSIAIFSERVNNTNIGAILIFNGAMQQQQAIFPPAPAQFNYEVPMSFSPDGSALAAPIQEVIGQWIFGGVVVYTRTGGLWSPVEQLPCPTPGSESPTSSFQFCAFAFSSDSASLVVGPTIFHRVGSKWTNGQALPNNGMEQLGSATAFLPDGSALIVGASQDEFFVEGAVYVFQPPAPAAQAATPAAAPSLTLGVGLGGAAAGALLILALQAAVRARLAAARAASGGGGGGAAAELLLYAPTGGGSGGGIQDAEDGRSDDGAS